MTSTVASAAAQDIVAQAAAGDSSALDSLIRPMLTPGYRLAYMLLRDREAAEDAVQEAALKSWRKLAQLRPEADPRPWFFGFVANECRNSRRSRWRSVLKVGLSEASDVSASGGDPDLLRALTSLSHPDRTVVLLHFYLDLNIDEIAVATKSGSSAVRSRLYRAVKRLRPQLELEEVAHG
jgi:RNA polymerase sigma-70 factor (ECF subfamily)